MMLAEQVASNINWTLIATIIMALATAGMWWDAKKSRVTQIAQPLEVSASPLTAAEIQRDVKAMNHRLRSLEDWRNQLIQKLEEDKGQVIEAGEDRARRIYQHVEEVRKEIDGKISDLPNQLVALLKNTGAIG